LTIPLWTGYGMYRNNLGLRWERTLKKDDNGLLVRDRVARGTLGYVEVKRLEHRIAAEQDRQNVAARDSTPIARGGPSS
jgi:hypothetical protein